MSNRFVPNRRRRVLRVWLVISVVSLFVMAAPFLFEGQADFLDFSRAGGAMTVFGLMIALTGFITAGFYAGLAKTEDRLRGAMAAPSETVLRWTYSTEEWSHFVQESWKKDRTRSFGIWRMIAIISVAVSPLIALVTGDIPFTALFLAGLLAFLSLFAFGAPLARRGKLRRSVPEVALSREGLLVGSALHPFSFAGAALQKVEYKEGWLAFGYAAPTRTGMQDYEADVWIPERLRQEVSEGIRTLFGWNEGGGG